MASSSGGHVRPLHLRWLCSLLESVLHVFGNGECTVQLRLAPKKRGGAGDTPDARSFDSGCGRAQESYRPPPPADACGPFMRVSGLRYVWIVVRRVLAGQALGRSKQAPQLPGLVGLLVALGEEVVGFARGGGVELRLAEVHRRH